MSLLKEALGSQAALCWAGAKVRGWVRGVEVLGGDGEERCMSEDLSWAVGRTEGPQRKDCSLGLLRKRKKGLGEGSLCLREGFWCSPQLTDLPASAPSPGTDFISVSAVLGRVFSEAFSS